MRTVNHFYIRKLWVYFIAFIIIESILVLWIFCFRIFSIVFIFCGCKRRRKAICMHYLYKTQTILANFYTLYEYTRTRYKFSSFTHSHIHSISRSSLHNNQQYINAHSIEFFLTLRKVKLTVHT